MILQKIVVGPLQVNCYILASSAGEAALVIDPGSDANLIKKGLKRLGLQPAFIVNTHGHADHIGANAALGVPVYIHRMDAQFLFNPQLNFSATMGLPLSLPPADKLLEDGQRLTVGSLELKVIHTPGHTPGGICLNAGKFIFTGDTLFAEGVGRTDLPYASDKDLLNSIRSRLFTLTDDVIIYPGHGPASTIGQERKNNCFIE